MITIVNHEKGETTTLTVMQHALLIAAAKSFKTDIEEIAGTANKHNAQCVDELMQVIAKLETVR